MKKYIAFLLCLMMILPLVSCEWNEAQNAPSPKDNTNNTSTPLSDMEKAMEMYEAAIKGEICVVDEHLGEITLKELRFPSNDTNLDACKLLKKAILDVDQDGINEYVIQSPDEEYIILRYDNGKVYSYHLDTYDFYHFNTDGTFHWYDSSEAEGRACGLNRITFDKETLTEASIYSLQYSESPTKYEYFVEGAMVTQAEYYDYHELIYPKERMTFSYFELTHRYPITAEQAWNLANAYWDGQDGRTECSAGTIWTVGIALIDTPNAEANYYRVAFQVEWNAGGGLEGYECMPPHTIREHDQILVNAFTGEITTPACESGGKVISIEEAIEIAKKHCEIHHEENGYRVELNVNTTAPDHIYVIVIQKLVDHRYVYDSTEWVDKYTGEIVFPYYVYGKG